MNKNYWKFKHKFLTTLNKTAITARPCLNCAAVETLPYFLSKWTRCSSIASRCPSMVCSAPQWKCICSNWYVEVRPPPLRNRGTPDSVIFTETTSVYSDWIQVYTNINRITISFIAGITQLELYLYLFF